MSSIEKSIISNLEVDIESINFGVPELNKLFKTLDQDTQKKIIKYPHKEIQINILKGISDPEIEELYKNLSDKMKKQVDTIGLRDKYSILKKLLEEKKKQAEEKGPRTPSGTLPLYSPHSPSGTPPPPPT